MSDVTSAEFLNRVGKRTPLFSRFSTTVGEKGSPETIRDVRGMAFKLYTNEGNLDWVFLSQASLPPPRRQVLRDPDGNADHASIPKPVFSIRDGAKFPSFVHATKKSPRTGLPDHTMFWESASI